MTERGSASALVVAIGAVILAAGAVGVTLGQVAVARTRAATAADMAALAGAGRVTPGAACDRADAVAAAQGAHLVGCEQVEADVLVTVEVRTARLLGGVVGVVRAQARAGPPAR